jgi:hypothetical protein
MYIYFLRYSIGSINPLVWIIKERMSPQLEVEAPVETKQQKNVIKL